MKSGSARRTSPGVSECLLFGFRGRKEKSMKRSIRSIRRITPGLLFLLILFGVSALPSAAYIYRGDVVISGEDAYTLTERQTLVLQVAPYEEQHYLGCQMADCPQICGEKECIEMVNGQMECVCAGRNPVTFYADVAVASTAPDVAEATYDGQGRVSVLAKSPGTAQIRVDAAFREYGSAEKTIRVTVTEASGTETPDPIITDATPAVAQSYTIRTFNNTRAEDDQNIEIALTFDKEITVTDGAEQDIILKIAGSTLDQAPNTENGVSNRTLRVRRSETDPKTLLLTVGSVPGSAFIKQTNASVSVQGAESITHILTESNGRPVDLKYLSTVIPTGLELTTVSANTSGNTASVTKEVTHRSNVRSMVYIQMLKNGEPILPTDQYDHEGSYIIHAHAFVDTLSGTVVQPELTESDYAGLIVSGFDVAMAKRKELSSRYTMTQDGARFTLTDTQAEAGETLDVRIYEWPYAGSEITEVPAPVSGDHIHFEDVNGWEKEYVYYLVDRGIVNGKTNTIFAPLSNITRAEFAKILSVASGADLSGYQGQQPFQDVPQDMWYAPYVAWARDHGIVNGLGDGTFGPDLNITRQDMAVMIQRYANQSGISMPDMETPFAFLDENTIWDYAIDAVKTLQKAGIINGDINGNFYPRSNATRAQAAKMIAVFLQVTGS